MSAECLLLPTPSLLSGNTLEDLDEAEADVSPDLQPQTCRRTARVRPDRLKWPRAAPVSEAVYLMNPKPSQVYVLRVWYEPSPEGEVWRASVSQGEDRHYFADVSALTAFLKQEMEAEREEAPE